MSNTIVRSSLAIAYEISADSKGNCSLTIRGAARALGVNESSIRKQRIQYVSGCGPEVQKNLGIDCPAKVSGCGPEDETQISDSEFAWLMKWYGFLSPRGRTDEARNLLSLVLDIGVRGWMQAEAGHDGTVQELVQSVKTYV